LTAAMAGTAAGSAGARPGPGKPAASRPAAAVGPGKPAAAAHGTTGAPGGTTGAPGGAGGALGLVAKVLPYLTVVIAAFAPLAASVYLVASTGWSVAERWLFASSRRRQGSGAPGGDAPRAGHTPADRARRS
jgi:YidC/Oxa1 family membrane protein insertase